MKSVDGMQWYAVNTKPHQENLAALQLNKAGIETFYPQLKQQKRIRGMRQTVIGPLFPGYLFARFSLKSHYRTVQYAMGVRRLVAFGLWPEPVAPEIIDSLKARVQEGYVSVEAPSFRPLQTVRIAEGPFEGLKAVFEREMSDGERVVLLLRTLSYQARVVIEREKVLSWQDEL